MTANITVVGGGIAGCASALALARAGWRVTLVEKDTLLAGASGAALGGLFPYTDKIKTKLAAVQRASVAAWPGYAAELSALSGVAVEEFYRDFGGVGQVHVAVMEGVWRKALAAAGVEVVEGVDGEVRGPVLWCAGWGNRKFFDAMALVEGQALRVKAEVAAPVYGEEIYVLPGWARGEAIIGSSKERLVEARAMVVREERTAGLLLKAGRLVEGLERAEVIEAWVGQRPSLPRGVAMLPLVRAVSPQTWAVVPLGGIGWCLAPALAVAVVETVVR